MLRFLIIVVCALVSFAMPAKASQELLEARTLRAEKLVGSLAYPWSLAFLPDGGMLVTEKIGKLKWLRPGQSTVAIRGVPRVRYGHQGGLLDVVLAPDFSQSNVVYLSYSHADGNRTRVRVLRARLDLAAQALVDGRVIFQTDPAVRGNMHLGGRMVVTADGYLFLTLGERGDQPRAQDRADHAGSVIRIHADGRVPEDNPFVGRADVKPEIWSYGHRNPQGLALDEVSGALWLNEHGPRGGDELNKVEAGQNYGWPLVSHGVNYIGTPVGTGEATAPGITAPVHYWVPSIATCGLAIVRYQDRVSYWTGGLVGQMLARVEITPDGKPRETRFLQRAVGRIRDVRLGPDGHLYILTDSSRGALYRLHVVD